MRSSMPAAEQPNLDSNINTITHAGAEHRNIRAQGIHHPLNGN